MPFDPYKIYTDIISWIAVTVIGGMVAWVIALRRKVNTNEKLLEQNKAATEAQFALIMQRLDQRDDLRSEDREAICSLETDVRELRKDIRDIRNAVIK